MVLRLSSATGRMPEKSTRLRVRSLQRRLGVIGPRGVFLELSGSPRRSQGESGDLVLQPSGMPMPGNHAIVLGEKVGRSLIPALYSM